MLRFAKQSVGGLAQDYRAELADVRWLRVGFPEFTRCFIPAFAEKLPIDSQPLYQLSYRGMPVFYLISLL